MDKWESDMRARLNYEIEGDNYNVTCNSLSMCITKKDYIDFLVQVEKRLKVMYN